MADATIPDEPTDPGTGRGDLRRTGELSPGMRFGAYVIEGIAGRGGMGIVYRARQVRPSRIVALKVISPALAGDDDFRERFAAESEIAASIEHSNVIPVYEVGEESGLLYIVMRYVEGTDLGAVIAATGAVPPHRTVQILVQLTAALDAAHARGLVHRDVKPANVLIAGEGEREHVYLTDFGLAKLATRPGLTRTGSFVGTLDYAAPEQFEGRRVDARTDVYAAGCLLYHMLTGTIPFPLASEAAIMRAHLSAQPPSARARVPTLRVQFDAVMGRAMAKDPDDRYPSAGDLGRDAVAAAEGQRATEVERSVATGRAAPAVGPVARADAASPTLPDGSGAGAAGARAAGARPERARDRFSVPMIAIAAAALVGAAIVILAVSGVFGSGGGHRSAATTGSHATTPAPATSTYSNSALGVAFSYPASWHALTLKGAAADFGTGTGAAETRCALVIDRGVGPANGSQEAQFAYVRQRSAAGASKAKHYELRAIQAEQGANITGVGLVRVADGQGGHLGFFFFGRDVYAFDCITPAATLDQVDQQAFRPLLASVRIG